MLLLTCLTAFALDFVATAAGVKALLALNKLRPLPVANWSLLMNLCGGTVLILSVFSTMTAPVFLSGCAGCWVADYTITWHQRRRERDTNAHH